MLCTDVYVQLNAGVAYLFMSEATPENIWRGANGAAVSL